MRVAHCISTPFPCPRRCAARRRRGEERTTDMTHAPRIGWKIVTHDRRIPLQGGEPLWTGDLPVVLPPVPLDTSAEECGMGWNYCADIQTAWLIAGLWPTGRPALVVHVEASADAIQRGTTCRASSLTLRRLATAEEIRTAMHAFSAVFGDLATEMVAEQLAWHDALARPRIDRARVEAGLVAALEVRQLPWTLKYFDSARDAWD